MYKDIDSYIKEVNTALGNLNLGIIERIIKNIERVKGSDKHVYLIGNGGSAATAIHMACDLVKKCNIKAIALTANIANITAFANDVSYDDAFSEQLRVFL